MQPVLAALLLDRPHDDRLHHAALLHVGFGRRFLHRRGDDVPEPRVTARRPADLRFRCIRGLAPWT